MPLPLPDASLPEVQRHTVRTLVVTQALGGVGLSSGIAVSALLAKDVSGSETLAGLAQTSQVVGAAVISAVLASLMARRGRRPGLALGYLLGAVGAAVCIVAATVRAFPLLIVGCVMLGATTAANSQSRYAATDLAEPDHRGRDLSTVVWATTLGSVLGPNLTGPGAAVAGWLHIPDKAGPFVFSLVGLLVTSLVVSTRLRPDPLLTARGASVSTPPEDDPAPRDQVSAWDVIRTTPRVRASVAGMALTHAVMVSVMVMTPIHMDHGHASLEIIGLVISIHVLGMFAVSPLVGLLVDRWGSPPVLAAGGVVLLVALVLAGGSAPGGSIGLGVGLFLLGLGWSLGTVASSTLLTASTLREHRPQVQGVADMITGLTAAGGGALAGIVVGTAGFGWLNAGASVLAVGVLGVAMAAARQTRRREEVSADH